MSRFEPGDRVMAVVAGGGQAELAVVHERTAMPVPEELDWTAAGGVPEVFTTAHDALFTQAALIVGSACSSTARRAASAWPRCSSGRWPARASPPPCGTSTAASRSPRSASNAIAPDEFVAEGPFDVILELVGAPNFPGNLEALAVLGRIAVIGVGAGPQIELNLRALMGKRARIHGSVLRARSLEDKAAAARLVEKAVLPGFASGDLSVPVAASYPLDDVDEAYERFKSGGKLGKIVLEMSP